MSRQNELIKGWLALEAWRYASYVGGDRIMTTVACALANRVKQGWGSWWEVLRDIPLYGAMNIEEIPRGYPNPDDPSFIRLLVNIDKIFNNEWDDKASGANGGTFFGDLAKITRPWFLEKIVRSPEQHHQKCACGTFTFWD